MPVFELNTNVPTSKVSANLVADLTNVVASALGKPASYVAVQINAGANLAFGKFELSSKDKSIMATIFCVGGSGNPAGISRLSSIGQIDRQKNKETSKKISAVLEKELGIASDRLYIEFVNLNKENVGYSGTTFDDLL